MKVKMNVKKISILFLVFAGAFSPVCYGMRRYNSRGSRDSWRGDREYDRDRDRRYGQEERFGGGRSLGTYERGERKERDRGNRRFQRGFGDSQNVRREKGGKRTQVKDMGNSPLHDAVLKGYVERIRAQGEHIEKRNNMQQTAFHLLVLSRKYDEKRQICNLLGDALRRYCKDDVKRRSVLDQQMQLNNGNKVTALNLTISKGCDGVVKRLIEFGADVTIADKTATGSDTMNSLHYALLMNSKNINNCEEKRINIMSYILDDLKKPGKYNTEVVKKFLNAFGNTDSSGSRKSIALNLAISKGHDGVVKRLIELGADVTIADKTATGSDTMNSLHYALLMNSKNITNCEEKRINIISYILDDLKKPGKYNTEVVKKFLNAFGNTDSSGSRKSIVLNLAISKGHDGVVKRLIEFGADVTIADKTATGSDGCTSLHGALLMNSKNINNCEEKRINIISYILDDLKKPGKYDTEAVKKFLNTLGNTDSGLSKSIALKLAISKGYDGVVKRLIELGADVTSDGCTSLHSALLMNSKNITNCEEKRINIISYILDDLKKPGKYNTEAVKKFLNTLANTDSSGSSKSTALNLAISKGYDGVVKRLIELGADVTIADSGGKTSFICAVVSSNINTFELLVRYYKEMNIDLDVRDKEKGRTCLQWVLRLVEGSTLKEGREDAVRLTLEDAKKMIQLLLTKLNARIDMLDKKGFNALHWIVMYKRFALMEHIITYANPNNFFKALCQPSERVYNCKETKVWYRQAITPIDMILESQEQDEWRKILSCTVNVATGNVYKDLVKKLEQEFENSKKIAQEQKQQKEDRSPKIEVQNVQINIYPQEGTNTVFLINNANVYLANSRWPKGESEVAELDERKRKRAVWFDGDYEHKKCKYDKSVKKDLSEYKPERR